MKFDGYERIFQYGEDEDEGTLFLKWSNGDKSVFVQGTPVPYPQVYLCEMRGNQGVYLPISPELISSAFAWMGCHPDDGSIQAFNDGTSHTFESVTNVQTSSP